VLRECALAEEWGMKWYYLGYWVQGNATMAYKGKFFPRETMNWDSGNWNNEDWLS
jgi:arginine-tRNA-protein transferase